MKDFSVDMVACLTGLVLLALFMSVVCRKLRLPYTIMLVLLGMGLYSLGGWAPQLGVLQRVHLTPNIILYVLLPTLIFDAAIHLDCRELLRNLVPILLLAAPGVLVVTAVTGVAVAMFTPLGLNAGMLFGALISTTDPVAVIALFNELGAPKRLRMLVDGESLFNDATAIVIFDIVAAIVAGSLVMADPRQAWSFSRLAGVPWRFLAVFVGGAVAGALTGWVMMKALRWTRHDPLVEVGLTTVTAYAAFVLANYYLHFSGVMAACGAGMMVNYMAKRDFSESTRQYIHRFWSFAAFMANSMIFLLLGMTESMLISELGRLAYVLAPLGVAVGAVLVSRVLMVEGVCMCYNPFAAARNRITDPMRRVMVWGGLRGALPIALAVSIPEGLVTPEERHLIIRLTLGVILFTLLVQGTTIGRLMRRLGLEGEEKETGAA